MPAPGPPRTRPDPRLGPRPHLRRGASALAVAALLAAAQPPGPPAALAQTTPAASPGTPGGPEAQPRLGPQPPPLPEPGTLVAPGPEIPPPPPEEPEPEPGLEDGPPVAEPGLGEPGIAGVDPVARPEIGLTGDPLSGIEGLDPDLFDPLGLDREPGRIEGGFARAPRRDRAPRPGRPDAERGEGGLTLSFGVDLGVRLTSNPELRFANEEEDARLTAGVSAGLTSRTPLQSLALDLDADARLSSNPDADEDEFEIESPELAFAYEREGSRSRLGAAARLRSRDLDEARLLDLDDPFDGLPEEEDLIVSGGTRTDLDAELELATGLDRPLGLELGLRADLRRFEDVGDDPDLTDRDILGSDAALRFDLTPRLTARLVLAASELEDDSGEERSSRSAGVTAAYAATETLRLTAALGTSEIDALRFRGTGFLDEDGEEIRALSTSEASGVEASFGVVRELPRGRVSAEVETEIEEGGRRDTLRVARALQLRQGTEISASVGLSREDGEEAAVVGDLSYVQEIARGRISASLRRRAGTDAGGDQVAATSASLGVLREITAASSLRLDLDFASVEEDGDDESQSELRLAYVRALTRDWNLSAGYELARRAEDDDTAVSNAFFLTLGRDFLVRP